jgi:hypothetical protein
MTAATPYTVPDNPTDPEAAALELIVRLPASISDRLAAQARWLASRRSCRTTAAPRTSRARFSGLSWADAKPVAVAVCFDVMNRDHAADYIRNRARNVLAGTDNMVWENRERAARALNIAATVLGL